MSKKLTLVLSDTVIENAKKYARKHHISLSKLVEFYFKSITNEAEITIDKIPPITKELTGIAELETGKTDKELLVDALINKYLK